MRERCLVEFDREYSYDAYMMKSGSFREYERVAECLIKFVQKVFKIRLSKIVCDFVKGADRVLYLVGVNYFEIDNYEKVIRSLNAGPASPDEKKLTMDEIVEDKLVLVYCKLCDIAFKQQEVSKIVVSLSFLDHQYDHRDEEPLQQERHLRFRPLVDLLGEQLVV